MPTVESAPDQTDTSLLAHGAVPAEAALPEGDNRFTGHDLSFICDGDVAVLIETVDPTRRFRVRDDLLVHSEVLNTLATRWPVVPFAFGATLRDEQEVRSQLLEPHGSRLQEQLDSLTGRAQFTLRASYVQESLLAEIVADDPQIAALREQTRDRPESQVHSAKVRLGELVAAAVDARRRRDVSQIVDALAPFADDHRVSDGAGLDDLADVSFLLRLDRQEDFEHRAEETAEKLAPRARLRLIGPLAAFDFVGEPETRG